MSTTDCPHGHDSDVDVAVDSDGRTSCCGAFSTIFIDDGIEYCKCCYAEVSGGEVTQRYILQLKPGDLRDLDEES